MRGLNGMQCPFEPAQLFPHRQMSVNSLYLMTYGLTGEPTPPVIGSAGATNMNS